MATSVMAPFVAAKLHGMRAKLFEGPRLEALTTLRSPFEMMSAVFPNADVRERRDFERKAVEAHVRDLDRLRVVLGGRDRAFFDWQLERYRIENIKVLLRAWKDKELAGDVTGLIATLPPHYDLPVDRLLASAKLNDFAKALPVRRYELGIERGTAAFNQTRRLFYVEASLDALYFTELKRRAMALSAADQDAIRPLMRREVLIYNVLFTVRARLNLRLEPDDVSPFFAGGVNPARFEPMLRAGDFAGMLAAMPSRRLLLGDAEPKDAVELQRGLYERLYRAANAAFYGAASYLGVLEGFYYIKRVELANLIRVAELLRQERPAAEIERELIRIEKP